MIDPVSMEMDMVRHGGQWTKQDGKIAGEGLFHHFKRFQELLWPELQWHRWRDLQTECFLNYTYIGEMGCAAAGKSQTASANCLADWYVWPDCTTVLVSSTDLSSLDLRAWGMVKQLHRIAKDNYHWIPGHLIEGRRVIIQDPKSESSDGRDFKNGIVAVPCKKGSAWTGLQSYAGIHNKRVRLLGDELALMPRVFLDSTSNLSKCADFKMVGIGNPNETTNAHGALCEPAVHLGGWEGGIDQTPKTKTWETRWPNGICIQLPGSDSPNMDAPADEPPPFPFLMTRKQMEDDAHIWGVDDWHFAMMNDAKMPRGQGSRRVLTRQACVKFGAFNPPKWRDTSRVSIAFLDAAYRGVGGDRCVFGELQFGQEATRLGEDVVTTLLSQAGGGVTHPSIIALIDLTVIPVKADLVTESPEDQIVAFCKSQCEARGIPPENLFFDAGMRTSLVTSFCRLWSTGVNSVDCGGRPSETQVSSEIKTAARDYYSKFVTELWFSVRYAVESRQFRGLTEEACQEFCQREWKLVSGNRIEIETKDEMKTKCFVSGTMVSTPDGQIPIESVKVGDLVETPFGASPVIVAHENETQLNLIRLEFTNGATLVGTCDHKVFTWDKGWINMDRLSLHSRVECVSDLWLWKLANRFFTRMTATTFKLAVDTISAAGTKTIRGRSAFYTGLSGTTTLGRYLKGNVSTTLTGIGRTTASKISNWFIAAITPLITFDYFGKTRSSGSEEWQPSRISSPSRLTGIALMKAELGTAPTAKTTGGNDSPRNSPAVFARENSEHSIPTRRSAPSGVPTNFFKIVMMTCLQCARSVANHLWLIATQSPRIALKAALLLPCGNPVKVYNLTLREHNAYYANGILVANCGRSPDLADAVAVGLFGARKRGFVIARLMPEDDDLPRGRNWKDEARDRARALAMSGQLNYAA
jgi:hypothetical protein